MALLRCPCWKFNSQDNPYSLLDKSIDEIWDAPEWDIAKMPRLQSARLHLDFVTTNPDSCQKLYARYAKVN